MSQPYPLTAAAVGPVSINALHHNCTLSLASRHNVTARSITQRSTKLHYPSEARGQSAHTASNQTQTMKLGTWMQASHGMFHGSMPMNTRALWMQTNTTTCQMRPGRLAWQQVAAGTMLSEHMWRSMCARHQLT